MEYTTAEMTFTATRAKGRVSALFQQPASVRACLVLAHGAGADMRHTHMQSIADALADVNVATLRFNFPYMEQGGGRTDSTTVATATIGQAVACARDQCSKTNDALDGLPLMIGGHSFGGRMSSHFATKQPGGLAGLVYFSFPLHPAGKPGVSRADHMYGISLPQLFLSGTRDKLAEPELLKQVVGKMQHATLHELATADHGFKILKRSRDEALDVYTEAAEALKHWLDTTIIGGSG